MTGPDPTRLRVLAGGHRQGLLALLDRCSEKTLYERFLSHAPTAGPEHVDALFADPQCHTVVVERRRFGGTELIGFGSLFFAGSGGAEIALLVADEYQGHGIGTMLAEHLCRYAAASGTRRLELTALARNHRIIRLFRRCAPTIDVDPPDAGTVTATVRLPSRSTYELAAA
ncbi:MAG TPA: GNAT family N-acetyltransferase [Kribbellaceae bacterium]